MGGKSQEGGRGWGVAPNQHLHKNRNKLLLGQVNSKENKLSPFL